MVVRRVAPEAMVGPSQAEPRRPFPDLVAAVAAGHPETLAVRQGADRLTYADLVSAAAALAGQLRDAGARPETVVAVCARRRPALLVALLGTLLSGAAYLPLDPSVPAARLRALIGDSGARVLVADADGAALLAGAGCVVVDVEAPREPTDVVPCPAHLDQPAYVMYTSGSTGEPKGVVVSHRALASFLRVQAATTGLGPGDVSLGFASVSFDVSILHMFAPLVAGASVALAGEADRADAARLQRFCVDHGVTILGLPPALLPLLDPAELRAVR